VSIIVLAMTIAVILVEDRLPIATYPAVRPDRHHPSGHGGRAGVLRP
jgi:hypothetical protein